VDAAAYFVRAVELNPGVADRMMTLAAQSLNEDDYKVATALLTSVSDLKQNSAEWHGMLGYSHFKLDHIEAAMDHLQKAIRLDPTNEEYYLDLAELFGANNASLASVVVFENGIKALPNSIKMRLGLAVALLLTGNLERAEEEINLAIIRQPSSEMAYKVLLEIYDNGMQWSKMQDAAVQLRKLNSRNPLGWYYGAKAEYRDGLENQRTLETALELIRTALELDSSEWRSHFLLGKILIAENRHKEAIVALRQATHLNSEDSRPYYALGTALQRLGKSQEAVNAMKTYQETKSKQQLREFRRLLVDIKGSNPK
jgi:Flp pilus assembly protein TadD